MSIKLKSGLFSQKRLLYILIVSGIIFTSLPLSRYGVEADLISWHSEQKNLEFKERLPLFHDNTLSPVSELEVKKPVSNIEEKPKQKEVVVVDTITTTITGYSSTVDQTNSDPFITASGHWVRDGIVAANFLPFGTQIRIPQYFGNKVFVVQDRMNRRHSNRVDVWFHTRQQAINFGIKQTYIEIVETI